MRHKTYQLIGSILLCQLAGILGSLFTANSIENWYLTLVKPSFNPPNWIFGPVWTLLYTLMGIALFLVWQEYQKTRSSTTKNALDFFMIHLLLNAAWTPLFFGLQRLDVAFAEILILWAFILVLIFRFYQIHKVAGLLLVPYFAWVSFASILNLALWQLN